MKAFKSFTLATVGIIGLGVLSTGSYNTMVMQDDSFMSASVDIKFAKRLDEIQGKVVVGRMAASASPVKWQSLEQKEASQIQKQEETSVEKKQAMKQEETTAKVRPEPAIKGDLDLSLSNVYFKKPLKQGEFSGSARTVDGVIEEIYVSLPNGNTIEINTRERMMGNVFQYEDYESRETKSGMFYEVKPGTYMVTLANDSKYAGVRMEFKAQNGAEVRYSDDYYQETQGWGMDEQNRAGELAEEGQGPYDQGYEYDYQDEYRDNAEEEKSYGFDFKS